MKTTADAERARRLIYELQKDNNGDKLLELEKRYPGTGREIVEWHLTLRATRVVG